MTAQPILNAETIIVTAVRDALAPFVDTYQDRPKAYYQRADQGAPKPFLVFQFQNDITPTWRVGSAGAEALVTVRALAESAADARQLLAAAAPAMQNLSYPNYTLTARYVRSPAIPPLNDTYTSAHIWRIRIERS